MLRPGCRPEQTGFDPGAAPFALPFRSIPISSCSEHVLLLFTSSCSVEPLRFSGLTDAGGTVELRVLLKLANTSFVRPLWAYAGCVDAR